MTPDFRPSGRGGSSPSPGAGGKAGSEWCFLWAFHLKPLREEGECGREKFKKREIKGEKKRERGENKRERAAEDTLAAE